ncbi:MAG: CRISPR-associated endonuclease Cas9 [Bacteroidia bacterium]|nr:CRISPR-associated endonuclease Cas9 [Bacteroidia bacterium]
MKKILGLDLGVASIGWAIVNEQDNKQDLVKSGVRIIPIDSETSTNFSKGISTSKNADRRLKRSARRNNHRYKLRKHFLIDFLKRNNLWELDAKLFGLSALELYGLRHKALSEKISLQELARIWFHLNQKRGYIDSRKATGEEETNTDYVEKIKNRSKHLYENYKTVGSYFYHKLKQNPIYRIKSGNDKENIFLVDDYKLEFDLIWEKQKEYYPDFLTDVNKEEVRNRIIYYKRKLKSQKHLIGDCRFEKGHKCMPVSSPIAQELRLWQDVNKLVITNYSNEVFYPTKEQKYELFHYLSENEKLTAKDVLKKLAFPSGREGYKINYEKQITGYVFRTKLKAVFKEYNLDFTPYNNFDSTAKDFANHPFYLLWHLLYATDEPKDLKKTLIEKYSFSNDAAEKIMKLPIKNDFAALSSRTGRKLLPHLREGMIYSDACKAAGYNHSESITKEENENRKLISLKDLEIIKPNTLKNPTVEKILNQLINLLKSLNQEGHNFDEIRIELARDLKKNAKERQRITKRNRENEGENKAIEEELLKHGFSRVSKKDKEKYKLWKEFNGVSPYEPNKRIELGELFDKALYEIEHIIPKSRLFDDSFNNKTIARTHINKEKDNQTAYDYMKSKSDEVFEQYIACIKSTSLSHTKKNYFRTEGKDIPDDFINRQLNETRYITSETLKLLKQVCRNVYSTSGTVTDYLRHNWGFGDALMDLNFDRVAPEEIEIKEVNGKKKQVIKDWTKRADHRHHALDAIVIACTKQSYIQQLNKLNQTFDIAKDLKEEAIKHKAPFNYEVVKNSLANILISFKPGKKVATLKTVRADRWGKEPGNIGQKTLVPRGSLHEESVYGSNKKQEAIDIRKLQHIEKCAVTWQKEAIENHLLKYNGDLKSALKNLKKDPIKFNDKELKQVTVFINLPVKRYDLQYTATNKFNLKAAAFIVNDNVRRIVEARLKEFNDEPALAFKNLKADGGNPLYFNKENGILINSVRCYTTKDEDAIKDYPALHEASSGRTLNQKAGKNTPNKIPVDFVKGGNNHHIAIYEDTDGKRFEECISLMEAFERKKNGLPVIQTNHPNGYKFIVSIQQNEMFVFEMSKEELENAIEKENYHLISKNLYRVQKIQVGDYTFRNHLETKLDDSVFSKKTKKFIRISSINNMNGIKVNVSKTGKIKLAK